MKATIIERGSLPKQFMICTAAYPAAFIAFFLLPMALKGNVGTGTLDLLSKIVSPLILFVLGFIFARWLGAASQLISIIIVPRFFAHQTEQMVDLLGNRAYSYASAQAVPFIFIGGWALTMCIIFGRDWLTKRTGRNEASRLPAPPNIG